MKRFFYSALAVLLATVMAFGSPVKTYAESRVTYISDVKLGYGDEGKAALQKAGYTVWDKLDANAGGKGSSVWIGYLETDNPDEAITDIALMNMRGGYSFKAYQDELAEMQLKIQNMITEFKDAIDEFRANYAAGDLLAVKAVDIMNLFVEEDSGKAIGDIILDSATDNETLEKIFLQGNTEILDIIENALALGCSELGRETFLDRLAEEEYTEELDPELNLVRTRLVDVFPSFQNVMKGTADVVASADAAGSVTAYCDTLTDDAKASALYAYALYEITTATPFADTGMTLYDFAMLDTEEENEDGWMLCDELIDLLARALTKGQRSVVFSVGLSTLITNACIEENFVNETVATLFGELDDLGDEKISVYTNVDRTLFTDTETVALTSSALREKAASDARDFGKYGILSDKAKTYLKVASGVVGALGIGALVSGIAMKLTYSFTYVITSENMTWYLAETCCFGAYSQTLTLVSMIGGFIAICAAVALVLLIIQGYVIKIESKDIEYTAIPRVLVDLDYDENGNKTYRNYYAAKLITAPEESTDSLALYGDLNALNKVDEWDVLYFTKDKRVGSPMTTNLLVSDSNVLSASQAGLYTPIHRFGSDVPANLNQYNTTEGAKAIYAFFRTNAGESAKGQAGSLLSVSAIPGYIIAFLVGAGIAAGVTVGVSKKRKPKTETAE